MSRPPPCRWLVALLLLAGGCEDTLLIVSVTGIPPEATRLQPILSWTRGPMDESLKDTLERGQHFMGTNARFGLRPPADADDVLTLTVEAWDVEKDAKRCLLARKTTERQIGVAQRVHFDLDLDRVDPRACGLTVKARGSEFGGGGGRVVSVPPGISCTVSPGQGPCAADFKGRLKEQPMERRVRLVAEPDKDSYVAGWEGVDGCSSEVCEVLLDEPRTVTAYFAPRVCSQREGPRWCWRSPLPQGNDLTGAWAEPAPDDRGVSGVWTVGKAGVILRWDGHVWAPYYWSGSGGVVLPNLLAVWGRSAKEAWAVGASQTILNWDGTTWRTQTNNNLGTVRAVWAGAGPRDPIWAVTDQGDILSWNGREWAREVTIPGKPVLNSIWGSDKDSVWVVGSGGTFWHFDGKQWRLDPSLAPFGAQDLNAVSGVDEDLWIAGDGGLLLHRSADGAWKPRPLATRPLRAIWAHGRSDVWIAGDGGVVLWWNGMAVQKKEGVAREFTDLQGIAGKDAEVWFVGSGGLLRHGRGDQLVSLARTNRAALHDVWGTDPDHVWAVGAAGTVVDGDGHVKTISIPNGSSPPTLRGVWGSGPNEAWAVSEGGEVYRYKEADKEAGWTYDSAVRDANLLVGLRAVSGTSATDIWAAGSRGRLAHYEDMRWQIYQAMTTELLNGLWMAGSQDLWTVGDKGVIRRLRGATWSTYEDMQKRDLSRVSGPPSGEVFAVGSGVAVLRWDGAIWKDEKAPLLPPCGPKPQPTLNALFAGPDDVWAGGDCGVLLRRGKDGTWGQENSGTTQIIRGIWGQDQHVFAVGGEDMVLRRQP